MAYRPLIDQDGQRTWERCEPNRYFRVDRDGIYCFSIGINVQHGPGSLDAPFMYFTFSVENFDEQSIEPLVTNSDGIVQIGVNDPDSYAKAAEATVAPIISDLQRPKLVLGARAPLGFLRPSTDTANL